jgi:hypothetical protein
VADEQSGTVKSSINFDELIKRRERAAKLSRRR